MDIPLAVAASLAAERLPERHPLRDELLHAGSLLRWLGELPLPLPAASLPPRVRAVGWDEPGYPEGLRHLRRPPPALFVDGSPEPLPPPSDCVAIVGSRRCTEQGRWVARDLAWGLARSGRVVVSGLALGIDAAAHEGALDAGGRTLAVLASPVTEPSPPRNRALGAELAREGGWLVSERAPRARVRPADFPRRNRLVAGLASVLVVVEAGVRSGTLSTVGHALALGREVAAVPGAVTSPASVGSNRLLRGGAHVVTSVEDVLELLDGLSSRPGQHGPEQADSAEARVLAGLPSAAGSVGVWVRASGLPAPEARAALARLEARGLLRRLQGGRLARVL